MNSKLVLLLIFLGLAGALGIASPAFRDSANWINIVEQQSMIGIVACGMLLMILLGGFDLSVGAVGAAASLVGAWVMPRWGIACGVLAALAMGAAVGLFNGLLIAGLRINAFVATLGTQTLLTGLLLIATGATPIYGVPESFSFIGLGRWGPVPIAALIYAGVALTLSGMLHFTVLGHHIYAVGGNPEASHLAGIRTRWVTCLVYLLGALTAAIAGLILLAQTSIGQAGAASSWPLNAIAAVAVTGAPLTGGAGGIGAVVLGTLLLGTIANALNQFDISPYWQPAITGAVVLLAVAADTFQRQRAAR